MGDRGFSAMEKRRERIVITNRILTAKKKIKYRNAIALISYNLGVTERKAREYIDQLVIVNGIKKVGDLIVRRK